ncbi:MAG: helix-turn-helix domain-containing protein [Spirochaetota bacterium]
MHKGLLLKKLRSERNYTLAYVASKVKITASMLSQIENGKVTPSLKSLEDLLKFYSVSLSHFFKQVEQQRYILVRNNETETIADEERGYTLTLLASKLQNNALETYLVSQNANAEIEVATLNEEINGERIIYIVSGRMQITLDGSESHILTHGDSLNFKAYVSCKIKNQSEDESSFLISGIPPIFL